jgi:hypothetical protein
MWMWTLLIVAAPETAAGRTDRSSRYDGIREQIERDRHDLRQRWASISRSRETRRRRHAALEQRLLGRIDQLFKVWLGSRWGLGMPQSTRPKQGKTNCGLFVAVILRDAGFNLPIWKFNRQAAYHGIKSLAPRRSIRYFYKAPMKKFLAGVRQMGPGLYLIGLDFHIGFLRQDERGLRFIHASYVTKTVVDEPAAKAVPIVTSRYRMVGKILQPGMLRAWLSKRRIKVLGNR